MNAPPAVVDVHVAGAGGRRVHLWLPVFVLWPFLLLAGGLAIAVAALVDAVLFAMGRPHRFTAFVLGCFDALTETRGTQVFVENESRTVDVRVW